MKKTIIMISAILASASLAFAAAEIKYDAVSNVSGKYLEIPSNAAAAGMGNAYICTASDSAAFFWNAAGIKSMAEKGSDISFYVSHNAWIMDMAVEQLSVSKNIGKYGVVGAGLFYFSGGEMLRTRIDSEGNFSEDGKYSPFTLAAGLSYSNTLEKNIDFGVVAKYLYDNIDSSSAQSFAFDLGVKYNTPIDGLKAAVTARNFGGQFKSSVLGKEVALGVSYSADFAGFKPTVEYNLCGKLENSAVHRAGLELRTPYLAVLRAGYQTDNSAETNGLRGISFGVGIDLSGKYIDASFEPMGDFGNSIKVSFGGSF